MISDKINIRIQVANPGFVNTPLFQLQQTASMVPALMSSEDAASRMLWASPAVGFEIAFPKVRSGAWADEYATATGSPLRSTGSRAGFAAAEFWAY